MENTEKISGYYFGIRFGGNTEIILRVSDDKSRNSRYDMEYKSKCQ